MQQELPFPKDNVVISLSGGMDSSTLLLRCLKEYKNVTAISFDYGQKHRIELERAQSLVNYLNGCSQKTEQDSLGTITITGENYPQIKYQVIKLDGLSQLLNSALVTGGAEVPEGHYAKENMKVTVVPNRNKIFASITQAVALSIATQRNETCDIALGIHAGDHAIYPDCRQEFRNADDKAFRLGNWESERVGYFTPYLQGNKYTILKDGEELCRDFRLNFDEVYLRTNTSYKPMQHLIQYDKDGKSWFEKEWFSDYKSASSVERIEAFIKLGRPDPVSYADEYGPVAWKHVVEHVKKVLADYEK
jgi:7-cyano-7-deazaguanine synthase